MTLGKGREHPHHHIGSARSRSAHERHRLHRASARAEELASSDRLHRRSDFRRVGRRTRFHDRCRSFSADRESHGDCGRAKILRSASALPSGRFGRDFVQSEELVGSFHWFFSPHQVTKTPNKAPEPTTMAVTPRAFVRVIEMKPQTPKRYAARGAPAMVVAHL